MDKERVKNAICHGLKKAMADFVYIDITQVLQILPLEAVDKLVQNIVETHEKSAIRGQKKLKSTYTGIGKFNPKLLLKAIEDHDKTEAEQSGIQLQTELLPSIRRFTKRTED